jgi:hypothetical protein
LLTPLYKVFFHFMRLPRLGHLDDA